MAGVGRGGTGTGRCNRGRGRRAGPAVRVPVRLRTAQRGRHSGRRGSSFGPASVDHDKPARGDAPALTAARRTPISSLPLRTAPSRRIPAYPQIGRAHVELQSLMRISYAVFCLKKKKTHYNNQQLYTPHTTNTDYKTQ